MGSMAAVVRMKVVDPSPSRETTAARTAVPSTTFAGSLPSVRRISFTSGSNRPTSIIMPKKTMANISNAAVEVRLFIESMTMSPMPSPAPANSPKMVGTTIRATTGVNFFVMISVMNTAIMANPRITNIRTPLYTSRIFALTYRD